MGSCVDYDDLDNAIRELRCEMLLEKTCDNIAKSGYSCINGLLPKLGKDGRTFSDSKHWERCPKCGGRGVVIGEQGLKLLEFIKANKDTIKDILNG